MAVLHYSSAIRMAVGDDPIFPSEETLTSPIFSTPSLLILLEWQTYFVKFYGDSVPDFFPQAGFYTQRKFPGQLFEITFRNAVGKTRIGPVHVQIESRKISETVYKAMLDYITEKYANLVFSITTPLGQGFHKEKAGQDIAYIEYLFLKKYFIDSSPNLDGISSLILANPHYRLDRAFRYNSIDAVASVSSGMLINMFSAADRLAYLRPGHPLLSTACGHAIFDRTGRRLYPSEAIEERKHHTVDTTENRFVKYFLQSVQRQLNRLVKILKGKAGGYLNPDIETHLEQITKKISLFLADPLWQDVGAMHFIPAGSQVLQRREGYRQLFQLYSLLQLATQCDLEDQDFKNLLETKDTPTLFEYWAFFLVKDMLADDRKMLSWQPIVSNEPLEQRISYGICIRYEGGISLWFNRTYQGSNGFQPGVALDEHYYPNQSYSHDLRPDIAIEKDEKILILDAKYKGQGGGFYGEAANGTIQKWKEEDIDKMHTYREAIRNVVGAYILYPGEEAIAYPTHNSGRRYEGVGALPLKPEAGACPVQKHLEDIKRIIQDFIKI